jgi:hypothetical protein
MSHRLLKVTVQPVFVDDDGETLREVSLQSLVVGAAEWAKFASSGIDMLVAQLDSETAEPASEDPPLRNRDGR